MTRKATPVNLLDELIPTTSETTAIRSGLKWDYSQAGDAADEVQQHAVEIKRSERRASEAIIEAGEHLLAVKGLLAHGQWLDWLGVEFGMSDRTAQRMMSVAEQFSGKSDTVSNLSTTVLYLLAADSTPEPARAAVIDRAASGETVTVAAAKAAIQEAKPKRLFVNELPPLIKRWMGEEWQQEWPENPAHTNGQFWQQLTAWMHANISDVWSEGDLKEAIKEMYYRERATTRIDRAILAATHGAHQPQVYESGLPVLDIRMPGQARYIPERRRTELLRAGYSIAYNPKPPYGDGMGVARWQGQPIGVFADGDAAWLAIDEHAKTQAEDASKAESNGYASQSQIERWLEGIAGTPAELREAAETRTGRVYEALVRLAWIADHYEVSPITASAALRNAATDREYAARKVGADAVQRSVDATAAYREATQVVLVQPARLREFQAAFEGAMSTLADWALECGHQVEASAAARAIRACIELIEKDLAE